MSPVTSRDSIGVQNTERLRGIRKYCSVTSYIRDSRVQITAPESIPGHRALLPISLYVHMMLPWI